MPVVVRSERKCPWLRGLGKVPRVASSGDFVFAVGLLHTELQFLMDSWERQLPGLGWEGSGILQRPHVAATSFTPLFFFPSWGET